MKMYRDSKLLSDQYMNIKQITFKIPASPRGELEGNHDFYNYIF